MDFTTIVFVALVAAAVYIFYKSFSKKETVAEVAPASEVNAEAPYKVEAPSVMAVGEPPATVVVPVEGAGLVEIPAAKKKAPAKKAPAKKTTTAAKKAPAKKAPARKPKAQ